MKDPGDEGQSEKRVPGTCSWSIRVPIFKNALLLRQLGLAIGIPFGIIILILLLVSPGAPYLYYALGLIGLLLLLTGLVLLIVFRGTYDVDYKLGDREVTSRIQENQAAKYRRINRAAILLGLFARNYSAAGAGVLAQGRQGQVLAWKRVRKVTYRPKRRTIILKSVPGDSIVLFCTPENYACVEAYVSLKSKAPATGPQNSLRG